MIDYEKLKKSHKLASNYSYQINESCGIDCVQYGANVSYYFQVGDGVEFKTIRYEEIDKLIEKLTELTQPEPKYKVGDEFFLMDMMNEIQKAEVITVNDNISLCGAISYGIKLEDGGTTTCWEKGIYPTKKALIEAQIEYWINQQEDHSEENHEKVECQHERDGKSYFQHQNLEILTLNYLTREPGWKNKCKKCGEFYI